MSVAFVSKTNATIERHKLLDRKQRGIESQEQFWGVPALLVKKGDKSAREDEWIRETFFNDMKKSEI